MDLQAFFSPRSIAVVGASSQVQAIGAKVFANLVRGGYQGNLYPVNPHHTHIDRHVCYPSVAALPEIVDLVVIVTAAAHVVEILKSCGEHGIKAALIISAGFSEIGAVGQALEKEILAIAKQYRMRLLGPNCLGIMRPSQKINATFDNNQALLGEIALVSQSGALCAGILDWSLNKNIGFSTLISLGNSADIDFGDILNYLAQDAETKSILLYIEGVHAGEKFLQGLRAAAKIKPVIVLKAGRNQQGSRAALSHTGALIGDDDVFAAALEQAGAIRVCTMADLFLAAEILSYQHDFVGKRLLIITNGGGAGVMAADRAADLNIDLPQPNEKLLAALNQILPAHWSHHNPVDIIGDATPERYHATLELCVQQKDYDAILVILVPVATVDPCEVAKQVIADIQHYAKPILVCWIGEKQVHAAWDLFSAQRIPYFDTAEKAVQAFSYLSNYHRNQALLKQQDQPAPILPALDQQQLKTLLAPIRDEKRQVLTAYEAKALLRIAGLPVPDVRIATDATQACAMAGEIGFPLAMKIHSPDITHKQDVGGVVLNITCVQQVTETFQQILAAAKQHCPQANLLGVTLEKMYHTAQDREVMIGVFKDMVFGHVLSFGAGGSLVEWLHDRALILPPINAEMARHLINKTRVAQLLGHYRHWQPARVDLVVDVLLRVAHLLQALPDIVEMDINPLVVNDQAVMVLDARVVVQI